MIETNKDLLKNWINDLEDFEWAKIVGKPDVGCRVSIEWENRFERDNGYSFSLPDCTVDELDFFIHIPKPDNSGGIGNAPQVYLHISQILSNSDVSKVYFL